MTGDPIVALRSLGYTEREASFLYLVAVHSGYFLRRQFDYFTDRNKGALVMRFLEKAHTAGHIESLDYPQGWHVYHLCSRTIYRLFGDGDSQRRRRKGDAQVRACLMALDYMLENENEHYLESEQERVHFFTLIRGVPPKVLTESNGHLLASLACFPISLADRTRPALSTVRFIFIDEGLATIAKLERFLACADPLLRAVGHFELVYISCSEFNFAAAKKAFWSRFAVRRVAVCGSLTMRHAWLLRNLASRFNPCSQPYCLRRVIPVCGEVKPGVLRRVHMLSGNKQTKCFKDINLANSGLERWVGRGRERPRPAGLPLTLVAPAHDTEDAPCKHSGRFLLMFAGSLTDASQITRQLERKTV